MCASVHMCFLLPLLVVGSSLCYAKVLEQLKLFCFVQVNSEEADLWKQLKQVRFFLFCWSAVAPVPGLHAPPKGAMFLAAVVMATMRGCSPPVIFSMRHSLIK